MWMSGRAKGSRICEESAHMGMWLTEGVLFELGSEGGVGFHQMEKELKDIVYKIQV